MIDRNKFFASLALAGLLGTAACGGSAEPVEEEAAPEETTGAETETTPEPAYEEATPEEEPVEPEEEMGPTPE